MREEVKSEFQEFKNKIEGRPNEDIQICFDLDGVICNSKNGDYENGIVIPEGKEAINKTYDLGYKVIVFTARFTQRHHGDEYQYGYEITVQWLRKHGIKFHQLIMGKPHYDLQLCDKSLRIDVDNREADWKEYWKQLSKLNGKNKYGQAIKDQ